MKKQKSAAATINAALRSGDTTRPIIGRDAYAPKNGNGTAAKKTLTALVKEAQEAAKQAGTNEWNARKYCESSEKYAKIADQIGVRARDFQKDAAHSARAAKWCAAIAAASAIISIITAAI